MRKNAISLFAVFFFGCAPQGGPGLDDDDPPLASHDSVFHGTPSNDSIPETGKADDVYPKQFTELFAYQSPVKNQASRGVCTVFSTIGLMEHLYLKAGYKDPDFSEQYLNWSVKVEVGAYANTEGSNNEENIEAIHRFGIVEESVYPYVTTGWTETNDADCRKGGEDDRLPTKCFTQGDPPDEVKQAKKFKLPEGRYLNTRSIKSHMTRNHTAVVVGLDFFYQSWNHGRSTLPVNRETMGKGFVLFPNTKDVQESHKQRAGHGILLVGWDDELTFPKVDAEGKPVLDQNGEPEVEKGFYVFKNSWGTSRFGLSHPNGPGFGYISQRYVEKYGTAYTSAVPESETPTPDAPEPDKPSAKPFCQYYCADWGFVANECVYGWSCDAKGECLTQTGGC